jgi:hypothetical protein
MGWRFASVRKYVFPLLLTVLLSGCASGPPGTSYPGADLVFCTKAASTEAQVVAQEANKFLTDLGDYLHLQVPPGTLLRIFHFPNRWGLWWHLNREVPSLRWKRGVCYETEEAYVVALSGNPGGRKFRDTLRHELTHYLVAAHFCDVPPWIDEGLSQATASGPPFPHLEQDLLEEVRREARRSKERGCLQLLRVPPGKKLSPSQYHVACALTYHLLTRSSCSAPTDLIRFLETTRSGVSPEQTFSQSWGISMEEACREMVAGSESGVR